MLLMCSVSLFVALFLVLKWRNAQVSLSFVWRASCSLYRKDWLGLYQDRRLLPALGLKNAVFLLSSSGEGKGLPVFRLRQEGNGVLSTFNICAGSRSYSP
jgi:hypothetical protein